MRSGPGLRLGRERSPVALPSRPISPQTGIGLSDPCAIQLAIWSIAAVIIMDDSACRATLPGRAGRSRHVPKEGRVQSVSSGEKAS